MCKVYEFPVKFEIPEEVQAKIDMAARDYVKFVNESVDAVTYPDMSFDEFQEAAGTILGAYINAIINAVAEYE